jgi:flavin reductase (DIM6/NTAB) family NADH-FMN oxidoreductase RutF
MSQRQPIPPQRALRLLAPGPVALLTARWHDRVGVMPVAWLCPVSWAPPRLAVAVHPARFTHDLVQGAGAFGLSFPARPMAAAVARAGQLSGRAVDHKLAALGLEYEADELTGVPFLVGCVAAVACSVVDALAPGDHSLFIGQVESAEADPLAFGDGWTLADESVAPFAHLGGLSFAGYSGPWLVPDPSAEEV